MNRQIKSVTNLMHYNKKQHLKHSKSHFMCIVCCVLFCVILVMLTVFCLVFGLFTLVSKLFTPSALSAVFDFKFIYYDSDKEKKNRLNKTVEFVITFFTRKPSK